jgi:hypothetical protein
MSDERPSNGSYAGWGLGGLIIVYFGLPAVWIWPIWKVFGSTPSDWLSKFGFPINWLAMRLPVYCQWVEWVGELLGIK